MENSFLTRSIQLLGEDDIMKLQSKTVCVIGIGGVGGTCFEALVRSGISKLIILDKDTVDITNLNRQILFTAKDVGKVKVEVAKKRAEDINPSVEIISLNMNLTEENIDVLDNYKIDYIVDAIDSIYSKITLIKYAKAHDIPFIISLGMAKRLDPSKVIVTSLNKSTGDPLAKKLRYLLKQDGVDISDIRCLLTTEPCMNNERQPASMMLVPSSAGLTLAYEVINYFIKKGDA